MFISTFVATTIPSPWLSKMRMYVVVLGIAISLIIPVSGLMPHTGISLATTTMVKSTKCTSPLFIRFRPQSITSTGTSTTTTGSPISNVLYSSMKPFNNDKKNQKKTKKSGDANVSTTSTSSFSSSNLVTSLSNRFDTMNIVYGVLWIILVTLAFANNPIMPHGDIVDQIDAQILQSIIENPTHPHQLNELYFLLFNLFAIVPILLASLLLPIHEITMNDSSLVNNDNSNQPQLPLSLSSSSFIIPPQPFILASAAIGYFAMGIYLTLRNPPISSASASASAKTTEITKTTRRNNAAVSTIFQNLQRQGKDNYIQNRNIPLIEEWSWYTKNLWENNIVQWISVAFIIYLPFGCQTISVIQTSGWDTLYHDFLQLLSSSRFVAISCMDLFLLHLTCISLIPYDYTYRRQYTTTTLSSSSNRSNTGSKVRKGRINQDQNVVSSSSSSFDDEQRGRQIATLAAFVPYLGTALYIALRPSVVIKDNDQ